VSDEPKDRDRESNGVQRRGVRALIPLLLCFLLLKELACVHGIFMGCLGKFGCFIFSRQVRVNLKKGSTPAYQTLTPPFVYTRVEGAG